MAIDRPAVRGSGRCLEDWLLYLGMTQKALGELADLNPGTIHQLVIRKSDSRLALRLIAAAIDVPYTILTEHGPDDPEARPYADAALEHHITRKMTALREKRGMRALTAQRAANSSVRI
jgi:transcriptional regulator with XRE-family HTH domain